MNLETVWSEFLLMAREEAGSSIVDTWLKALNLHAWDMHGCVAYITTPNPFVKDWVRSRYTMLCEGLLQRILHVPSIRIIFVDQTEPIAPAMQGKDQTHGALYQPHSTNSISIVPAIRAPQKNRSKNSSSIPSNSLQQEYQFANFVVGPHNVLAYSAAHAVVEKLGTLYNPFLIYGHSGLGKTHLLHAVGNAVVSRSPKMRIMYQSANRFVSDFIQAIRCDRIQQFEAKYRDNIDMLLIDDIQFLAHKEQTQEAFFHLFNTLYHAHKQIVCTSDSLPGDIAGLADRIRSRLVSGLVADISEPQLETKIAIIKHKAEKHGESITTDVAEYIASVGGMSVRDIEGALIRVIAYGALQKSPLTLAIAQEALAHATSTQHQPAKAPDMITIATLIEKELQCSLRLLRSQERNKAVSFARQIAMYSIKKYAHYSLREIGSFFNRKDHSTVLYAIDRIEQLKTSNADCIRILKNIEAKLEL